MNVSSVTAGCSPMKPAFGQEQNPQKHQKVQAINIDKAVDVINDIDFKNIDERSARNIARLADAINETEENAKYTKPLKQFFTTASLALLGGISAKVSAGKEYSYYGLDVQRNYEIRSKICIRHQGF